MKPSLLSTLVLIQISVIVLTITLLWIAIDYLAADYFTVLMEQYNVSSTEANHMFVEAVHRYLLSASVVAVLLAIVLSLILTRRTLRPLAQMGRITGEIAAGDFDARVSPSSVQEIAALAESFNRMADNLSRIEHLRRRLIGDAAHELRTPLCNIRGYLEAMRDGVVAPDTERLQMLHGETMRLVRLTDSLFELARADASHLDLRSEPLAVDVLLQEQLELLAPQIRERTIEVIRDTEAATVSADPDRLRQIIGNLLNNAVLYAATGGWVRVSCRAEADGARIEISNDGPGIPDEDLPLVFERFYRADKSRSSGGAGIGLAVVRELVRAHGGTVGIESADGVTCAWVRLPYSAGSSSNP